MFRRKELVTVNGHEPAKKPMAVCAPPEPHRLSDVPELILTCFGNLAGLFIEFFWVIIVLGGIALMAGYR